MVMLSQMIPPSGTTGLLTPKPTLLLCSKVVPRTGVSWEKQDVLEKGWFEGGAGFQTGPTASSGRKAGRHLGRLHKSPCRREWGPPGHGGSTWELQWNRCCKHTCIHPVRHTILIHQISLPWPTLVLDPLQRPRRGTCVTAVLHWPALPTVWLLVSVSHQSICTLAVGIRRTGLKDRCPHREHPHSTCPSARPTPIPSPTTNPSCPGQCPNTKLLLEN